MDSKFGLMLCAALFLAACSGDDLPQNNKGYDDGAITNYWFPTHLTADNTPDPIKKQQMLEDDMVACGYEVRDHRRWATADDPVSTVEGDVVDHKGSDRADTSLPTTYELSACMEGKGWVRLKHYYTAPY